MRWRPLHAALVGRRCSMATLLGKLFAVGPQTGELTTLTVQFNWGLGKLVTLGRLLDTVHRLNSLNATAQSSSVCHGSEGFASCEQFSYSQSHISALTEHGLDATPSDCLWVQSAACRCSASIRTGLVCWPGVLQSKAKTDRLCLSCFWLTVHVLRDADCSVQTASDAGIRLTLILFLRLCTSAGTAGVKYEGLDGRSSDHSGCHCFRPLCCHF